MKFNFSQLLRRHQLNTQKVSLLAGVAVLTLSALTVPAVLAQFGPPPDAPNGAEGQPRPPHNPLNLTEEQQAQMQKIHQAEKEQMDAILTTEQKARLQTARENREHPRKVFESLNLTDDQKQKLQALRETTRQQMDAVLTPEQRQQMQQFHQRHQRPAAPNTP